MEFKKPPKAIVDKREEMDGYFVRRSYPFWKEQFDMLYRDIDSGKFGENAKTGEFYLAIKTIKDSNPKPENMDELQAEYDALIQIEVDKEA